MLSSRIGQSSDDGVLSREIYSCNVSINMKKTILTVLGVFLGCMASNAALLLNYKFDQSGTTQVSSGSEPLDLTTLNYAGVATNYVTSAPTRPGSNGNALNFTDQNVDNGLASGNLAKGAAQANLTNANALFLRGGLASFTISTWVMNEFTPVGGVSGDRRIFSLRNGSAGVVELKISNTSLLLSLTGTNGAQQFDTGMKVPANVGDWYFLSVAYDSVTGAIQVYSGEQGAVLSLYTAVNATNGVVNTLLTNSTTLAIGNAGYAHDRRFDGYISDVRFYDEVLSSEQINALYTVPEPSVGAALGAAALLAGFLRLRTIKTN